MFEGVYKRYRYKSLVQTLNLGPCNLLLQMAVESMCSNKPVVLPVCCPPTFVCMYVYDCVMGAHIIYK